MSRVCRLESAEPGTAPLAGFCLPSAAIAALLQRLYFQRELERGERDSEVV